VRRSEKREKAERGSGTDDGREMEPHLEFDTREHPSPQNATVKEKLE